MMSDGFVHHLNGYLLFQQGFHHPCLHLGNDCGAVCFCMVCRWRELHAGTGAVPGFLLGFWSCHGCCNQALLTTLLLCWHFRRRVLWDGNTCCHVPCRWQHLAGKLWGLLQTVSLPQNLCRYQECYHHTRRGHISETRPEAASQACGVFFLRHHLVVLVSPRLQFGQDLLVERIVFIVLHDLFFLSILINFALAPESMLLTDGFGIPVSLAISSAE